MNTIVKYNIPKDSNNSTRILGNTTNNSGTSSSGSSESTGKLAETHLIWGQPFDGTQDISGDLNNVLNINAAGGDLTIRKVTDSEGETTGGNIYIDGGIEAGDDIETTGNVIGKKFIGDVEAETVETTNLTAEVGAITTLSGTTIKYDDAEFKNLIAEILLATDITTENLTVTKSAHFFELIIDKIKAAGGAVLLTPADGFKVDKVATVSGGYKVYWKATDGDKKIANMWRVNDLAICQTFNAAEGVSYNVSNKYYWALVTAEGTETIGGLDYHYITLSSTTKDGTLNPEVGDEIAMLGYRGTDDIARLSAIYIAAYNSIDTDLKAPLFCHYKGINDFNLKAHKYTWFAANGNTIRGSLKVESGQSIEDYITEQQTEGTHTYLHTAYANSADGSVGFTKVNLTGDYLYIGFKSDSTESDASLVYTDYTWNRLKGESGAEGNKGDKGDDGVGIQSVVEYYLATSYNSGITNESAGFTTSIQNMTPLKKYLWNYELVTKTDGTSYKTPAVIIGNYGEKGEGVTITRTEISYAVSQLGTNPPSGGWLGSIPDNLTQGYFLWTRTFTKYSDSTETTAYTVSRIAIDGSGVTVQSTSTTYAITTTGNLPNDSAFTYTSIPTLGLGDYLWSKSIVTFSDNTILKSYSVSRIGTDGENGINGTNGIDGKPSYLHIAYAKSADGRSGFSTSYFSGATYIGTYTDDVEADSQDYTKYTWARLRGEDGKGIVSIVNYYLATTYSSGVTTSNGAWGTWTTTIQTIDETKRYLWNYEVITYTDGEPTITSPHIIGVYGEKGSDATADFYTLSPVVEKAIVDKTGVLGVELKYQILHIVGLTTEIVTPSSNCYVRITPNNGNAINCTSDLGNNQCGYVNASYQTDYHKQSSKTLYFTIELIYNNSGTLTTFEKHIVPVVFDAGATLEINDNIVATVLGHTEQLSGINNDIITINNGMSQIELNYNSINSTVLSYETTINNLDGRVTLILNSTSNIEQTANSIQSTVSSLKISGGRNLFGFSKEIDFGYGCYRQPASYGLFCENGNYRVRDAYGNNSSTTYHNIWRLRNLGFNGEGGNFIVSFYIKSTALENVQLHIDLCDKLANEGEFITVTPTWKYVVLRFTGIERYTNADGYNGFIDFEALDYTTNLYIRHLQIERGTIISEFQPCIEDLFYGGDIPLVDVDDWNIHNENAGIDDDPAEYVYDYGSKVYDKHYYNIVNPTADNPVVDCIYYSTSTIKHSLFSHPGLVTVSFWAKSNTTGTEIECYDVRVSGFSYNTYGEYFSLDSNQTEFGKVTKIKLTNQFKKYYIHWWAGDNANPEENSEEFHPFRLRYGNANNTTAKVFMCGVRVEKGYIYEGNDVQTSSIRLTASDITALVGNISLMIDNKQITLNGDTEINGSLTLNDDKQGFILRNTTNSSTTQITPASIGNYINFLHNNTRSYSYEVDNTVIYINNAVSSQYDYSVDEASPMRFYGTINLGTLLAGTVINLYGLYANYADVTAGGNYPIDEYIEELHKNLEVCEDNLSVITYNDVDSTNYSYTVTNTSNISIRIIITSKFTPSNRWLEFHSTKKLYIKCKMGVYVIIPTDNYMLIGYDGMAVNFGNNKTAFIGSEGTYISYGDYGLKVSTDGILKYAGNPLILVLSGDTCTSLFVRLYAPINGCVVRKITSAGDSYLQPNDELVVISTSSGIVNFYLGNPSTNVGRKVYFKKVTAGSTINIYGTNILSSSGNSKETWRGVVNDEYSVFYVSDGENWIEYYCG